MRGPCPHLSMFFTTIGEGVFGVMLIIFVEKVLGYGAVVYGSLGSFQAMGSILAGILLGQFGKCLAPRRLLGICTVLFGIIDLAIIDIHLLVPGVAIIMALFVLVGIPGTGMITSTFSLFQSEVDDKLRGRIFGVFLAVESLMILIGMVLAGAFGDQLGAMTILNIQGGVYTVSGIFALIMLGGPPLMKQQDRNNASAEQTRETLSA
jgi:MFS family permease